MSLSLLIVDDNERFRVRARRWLKGTAFEIVAEAADGESGLRAAREHKPAVILLDIGLPDIDGLVVASRLAREPDPPVVVLTSTRDAADYGARAAECGARGFLPKAELSAEALAAFVR